MEIMRPQKLPPLQTHFLKLVFIMAAPNLSNEMAFCPYNRWGILDGECRHLMSANWTRNIIAICFYTWWRFATISSCLMSRPKKFLTLTNITKYITAPLSVKESRDLQILPTLENLSHKKFKASIISLKKNNWAGKGKRRNLNEVGWFIGKKLKKGIFLMKFLQWLFSICHNHTKMAEQKLRLCCKN